MSDERRGTKVHPLAALINAFPYAFRSQLKTVCLTNSAKTLGQGLIIEGHQYGAIVCDGYLVY